MNISFLTKYPLVVCLLFLFISMSVMFSNSFATYHFSDQVEFIDASHLSDTQENPCIDFDIYGNIHVAWSDNRSGAGAYPPYIYHRQYDVSSGLGATELIPMKSDCQSTTACYINNPELAYGRGTSANVGYCMFSTNLTVQGAIYNDSSSWNYIGEHTGDVYRPILATTADHNNNLFLAYSNFSSVYFEIRMYQYDPGSGWIQNYSLTPSGSDRFYNVDICRDDADYIYLVFDREGSARDGIYTCRSTNPGDISSWEPLRFVFDPSGYGHPRIDAAGAGSDLLVSITFNSGSAVLCITEENGTWDQNEDFSAMPTQVNFCSSCNVGRSDVAVLPNRDIYVTWHEDSTGNNTVRFAVSYDNGNSFLPNEILTETSDTAVNPRIAKSDIDNNAAIVCEMNIDGHSTIMGFLNVADFEDSCEDFSNWTQNNGVTISSAQSHDPGGHSYAFGGGEDSLIKDYGAFQKGSVDFWFYDDMSTDANFYFEIVGTDSTKGGVKVMLGIRNEVSTSKYCKNLESTKEWEPIPGDSGTRAVGWHHVTVQVDPEENIEVYLDPDENPAPVVSRSDMTFKAYQSFTFYGGSASSSGTFYVDDVRVVANPVPVRDVPTLNYFGVLFLVMLLSGLLLRLRH